MTFCSRHFLHSTDWLLLIVILSYFSIVQSRPSDSFRSSGSTLPEKDLLCKCSSNASFCDLDGHCNAKRVANIISAELDAHQETIALFTAFQLPELSRERNATCAALSDTKNLTRLAHIVFLSEEEWQPACVRVSGSETLTTCGIIPSVWKENRTISQQEIVSRLRTARHLAGCDDSSLLEDISLSYCTLGRFCNSEPAQSAGMLVELLEEVSTETLLLYTLLPILLLLLLIGYSCVKLIRVNTDNR